MTISEALKVLESCKWLKLSDTSVSACEYKSRAELSMLTWEDSQKPNALYRANVHVRRAKTESLEAMIVRAARLVASGHVPKRRVPPVTGKERCACGSESHDLKWSEQLKQRLCARCLQAWETAANHNDMRPSDGRPQ